ncbi:phage exclusion protein Lit family protein [Nocardia yunnanensis]|nr:phage exclusion protein Lit family protein [Nocardia yunnanensis]
MAARRKKNLRSERRKKFALLRSHEQGRDVLAFMDEKLREYGTIQDLTDTALTEAMRDLAVHVPEEQQAMIARTEIFVHDTELNEATTVGFPDGSHLIRISDAQLSLLALFGDLLRAWSRSKGRFLPLSLLRRTWEIQSGRANPEEDVILAGAASIRYYIHHQRAVGVSAQVASSFSRKNVLREDEASGARAVALLFLVAHEMSHVVLGHTASKRSELSRDEQHGCEFEADAFGVELVTRVLGGQQQHRLAAATYAIVGLLAISVASDPLYLRPPETHPAVQTRIDRVAAIAGPDYAQTIVLGWGLNEMVKLGTAVDRPFDARCWTALQAHPAFDTTFHIPGYYKTIQGYDMWIDGDPQRAMALIQSFVDDREPGMETYLDATDFGAIRSGVEKFQSSGARAALDAWGVRNVDELLDFSRPLSYHKLVSSIMGSAIFSALSSVDEAVESTRDTFAFYQRMISVVLAQMISRELRGART